MAAIQVFERPVCCSPGECESSVDPILTRFAADLAWLRGKGVTVERYSLTQQPEVFAANDDVNVQLARHGMDCLPIIRVDGVIVCCGTYPSRARMARWCRVDEGSESYLEGNCRCAPEVCRG